MFSNPLAHCIFGIYSIYRTIVTIIFPHPANILRTMSTRFLPRKLRPFLIYFLYFNSSITNLSTPCNHSSLLFWSNTKYAKLKVGTIPTFKHSYIPNLLTILITSELIILSNESFAAFLVSDVLEI